MKRFEHEVLTFAVGRTKDFAKMQDSLQEWGAAGYEVVSVLQHVTAGSTFTVFLKRAVECADVSEEAA